MERYTVPDAENFNASRDANENMAENNPQQDVLSAIDRQEFREVLVETAAVENLDSRENNYTFFGVIEPLLKDKKILDLFCGLNSLKKFVSERKLRSEVVGVDSHPENEFCDVRSDVSSLMDVLPPNGQFDIITSFGGTDAEKFSNDFKYLKEGGLLILGASEEINYFDPDTQGDLYKYFKPIVEIKIRGLKQTTKTDVQTEPLVLDNIASRYLILKRLFEIKI